MAPLSSGVGEFLCSTVGRFFVPTSALRERRAQTRSRLAAGHRRRRRAAALTASSTVRGLRSSGRRRAAMWRDVILDWAVNDACGNTASPCIRSGSVARNPDLSCTGEGKAQQRRDPSERAGHVRPWVTTVTRLSWFTSAVIARGRLQARTQHGAGGHHAGLEITPERHHELAGERHDGDAPDAALDVAHPLAEPAAQGAVGLVPKPQPGELDREFAGAPVAGFADALVAPAVAAVVRRAGEPEIAAKLAAIVEGAVEYLADQLLSADRADAFEVDELHDPSLERAGCGGAQLGLALGFERRQLLVEQREPLVLAHDLLLEPWRQRPSITGAQGIESGDEPWLERHGIADAVGVQQAFDAIGVSGALLEQALPFASPALAILLFHRRHMHHAAGARLAPQMNEECPHQLVQVDPIGLGAPCTAVDFDAGRVDLVIHHPMLRQPPMQPVPVEARLVARQDAHRLAAARRLRASVCKPCGQRLQVAAGYRVAAHFRRAR